MAVAGSNERARAGEVDEGRQQVHQRHVRGDAAGAEQARRVQDERHARGALEEVHLVPQAPLAQHVAMVGGDDDDGVVGQAGRRERFQQLAELAVDIADHGVVAVAGVADLLVGDAVFVAVVELVHAAAERIAVGRRDIGHRRHVDGGVVVARPVRARRQVGIVRLDEGDGQHERPLVAAAGVIVEPANGLVADLLVIVPFKRAVVGAGLDHAQHVVEPPVDLLRLLPRGRPAEIAGIDVGGDAVLVAMQLVGADEMHLAGKAGAITEPAQIVRVGRHGRRELGGVVPGGDAARQLSRHQREARGRAERRIAIGAVEHHAALGERLQVRGLHERMTVSRQRLRRHLVEHDEEDVRALAARSRHWHFLGRERFTTEDTESTEKKIQPQMNADGRR